MHLISERGDATDMAVQLCAASAIKEGVDVRPFCWSVAKLTNQLWELEISYFSPYLQQSMEQLCVG